MRGLSATPAPALIVASPGLRTTIQDQGRCGWQRLGVPVSGALDAIALAAANVVAGNPPQAAALECLYQGPELAIRAQSVRLALAGAGAHLEILDASGHLLRRCDMMESTVVLHGERVRVRMSGASISAYLAIEGGLGVPRVLGSRATYVRAAIGGFRGRALVAGDRLPLVRAAACEREERRMPGVTLAAAGTVRIVLGPQDDHFTPEAVDILATSAFTVLPASDRMGLRLCGPALRHRLAADIASDGIPPGAIQVPADGQPIVMLADRQTTGGYAKIATVISADLPRLGRLGPGAEVRFEPVSVEAAEALARQMAAEIARWPQRLVPVAAHGEAVALLGEANLISGVVQA